MAGRHKWSDLKKRALPPERLAAVEAQADREVLSMRLAELRRMLGVTQTALAEATGLPQSHVSKLETSEDVDLMLSTVRRYVTGLGGKLRLSAELPEGTTVSLEL